MANFQFDVLLKTSWLTDESVHNLRVIFAALSDERKIELMDNWPQHLDNFLAIERKGMEERKKNIESALAKIEAIIDDALERDRQAALSEAKKTEEERQAAIGAQAFEADILERERQKRLEMMRNIWRNTPQEATSLSDPLWNL